MASEDVHIRALAEDAGGIQLLTRITDALEKVANQSDKTGQATKGIFANTLGGDIAKFTAGMLGAQSVTQALGTAVNLLRQEYEQFLTRAREAAAVQVPFGDVQRRFGGMLSGMSLQQATQGVLGIASQTGVKASTIGSAFEQALSSKGAGQTDQAALDVLMQAAKYRPGPNTSVNEISSIARAQLEIMNRFPGTAPEQAIAGIANSLRADKSIDVEQFATYLLPAIATSRAYGATESQPFGQDSFSSIASRAIALGQSAGDPTGRRTATGFTNMLKQLRVASVNAGMDPNASLFGSGGMEEFLFHSPQGMKVRQQLLGPLMGKSSAQIQAGGGGIDQLLQETQNKMGIHSEAKLFIPIVEYLRGGKNRTWDLIRQTSQDIPELSDPRNIAQFQAREAAIGGSSYQTSATLDRTFSAGTEQLLIPNTVLGARGAVRERIPAILRAAGAGALAEKISGAKFDWKSAFATSPGEVITGAQEALRQYIVPERKPAPGKSFFGNENLTWGWDYATKEQLETNKILQEIVTKLEELKSNKITIESGGEERRGVVESKAGKAGQQP